MSAIRVAAVAAPFGRDIDAAFARIEETLAHARVRGVSLVVFPECALGGYLSDPGTDGGSDGAAPPALDPEGPEIARLAQLAGPTVVCAGYCEDAPEGPYNSAICVSGDGILGHHRKVHLPLRDRELYRPGEGFAAFDTPVGRLGMSICYDKSFPESARALALDGAEIVASMSAWPVSRADPASRLANIRRTRQFDLFDQARAAENQLIWVSANQSGHFGGLRFLGHAKVVDPYGAVVARTGLRAGVATASVDPQAQVSGARRPHLHLADRRPAAYAPRPVSAAPAAVA